MNLKRITTHIFVWVAYMVYEILIALIADFKIRPLNMLVSFVINAGVFYGVWLTFKWLKGMTQNKWLIIILGIITGAAIMAIAILLKLFSEVLLDHKSFDDLATKLQVVTLFMRSVYFAVMGVGFAFAELSESRQKEVHQHQLDNIALLQAQDKLVKNALQAELDLIKSQINPHFLFNTLGFLYSQTYKDLPKVGNSILMLSDIMRHALSGTKDGFSTLEGELAYINDYINIHQDRNDNIYMDYTPKKYSERILVVSMVLITLIENIFKHGLLNRPDKRAILQIELNGNQLCYYSFNYKNANRKMESNHIGMAYIEQRLRDEYGDAFKLEVNNTENTYECRLTFPVKL